MPQLHAGSLISMSGGNIGLIIAFFIEVWTDLQLYRASPTKTLLDAMANKRRI
jgi:hypothetical protein